MKRILFIAISLLVVATTAGTWWWMRQSLVPLDGEYRVIGLQSPVEVLFDDFGVPHVYANGPEDAWQVAGYLHARDRLWQMELYRRAASGRLSEIFGERTLSVDKRLTTLGLRAAAAAEWRSAPPAVRTALERYTNGVNAQIARAVGRAKPLEFQVLRFEPSPWTPIDSLAVGRLLAWRLAENHQSELVRGAVAAQFGVAEAQRITGSYPASAPTVLGTSSPAESTSPQVRDNTVPMPAKPSTVGARPAEGAYLPEGLEWLDPGARRGLSNNFVIAGSRTASGRPLLANDPHLQIEFPSVWYEIHLVAAGLDVMGVTIPGAPFVIIGHNARIAWGVTNTGADVQDLYVERVDLSRRRYLSRGNWLPVEITSAEIPVRGRDAEPFEVWRTQHGSLFAELNLNWEEPPPWLTRGGERLGERRAFALRWEIGGETAGAFEALNRASSWGEFTAAIERFTAPSQNFVYADVDGNIGYAMSGVLPLRASGTGSVPLDGSAGEGEWNGRVNPATLPRAYNPSSGFLTSSNNEIDRQWRGLITRDWAAPFRATRLQNVLRASEKIAVTGAMQLQNDVQGVAAERVLARLDQTMAAGRKAGADDRVLLALERLRIWDRKIDGRPVVAFYAVFEDAVWKRTFVDEMGDQLFAKFYEWAGAERPAGLYAIVDDPNARWFDDIGTINHRETQDDIYLLAARDAVDRLNREVGSEDDWNWSEMHAATFAHPLASGGFPLRWLFSRGPSEVVGDGTTVMRVSYHRLRQFSAYEIPSWRQVLDVGNWDESRVILPSGQSGHPMSAHYFDQNEMWRQGAYRPQPFTRVAVDRARVHRLVLVP